MFPGDRESVYSEGRAEEWTASPGATFGEYRLATNARADTVLRSLPADTGLVVFEFVTPGQWWHAQQSGRKWEGRLDPTSLRSHFDGRQTLVSAQLKPPPGQPVEAAPYQVAEPSCGGIVMLALRIGFVLFMLSTAAYQCSKI